MYFHNCIFVLAQPISEIFKFSFKNRILNIKDLFDFSYEDFTIKEYDPHPAISAPIAV